MDNELENVELNQEDVENVKEELRERAAEDLADAVRIEYGNAQEDVEVVNNVKAKLDQMLKGLTEGKDEYFAKTEDNLTKFRELASYFQTSIDTNAATNPNLSNLLKEQLTSVDKAIAELEKSLTDYENKINIIDTAVKYFEFKVADDGKCYVEQFAIDFAKLLLA